MGIDSHTGPEVQTSSVKYVIWVPEILDHEVYDLLLNLCLVSLYVSQ